MVKRMLARRKYRVMLLNHEHATKYFKKEEALETCTGIYRENAKIVYKQHEYKTGAYYKG